MSYNRYKSWGIWDDPPTTPSTSDPRTWTTTSALGLDGKAVSPKPEIKPTEGMKNYWKNPNAEVNFDFKDSLNLGKGLQIQPKGKLLDFSTKGAAAKSFNRIGGAIQALQLVLGGNKGKSKGVSTPNPTSGALEKTNPDISSALSNVRFHDDLHQVV